MAPAVAEVALEAELPVLAPREVVDLARLPLLALLEVVAELAVLVPLEVAAALAAELAVEEVPLHRSFSAAMVGNLPSTGTPRYSPVPRSGRKAKRRP